MDIPDFAQAIEDSLLGFFTDSAAGDEDRLLRNTKYTAYFIVEMSKRWAERKYIAKRIGREVSIEETVTKSREATEKFFRRQERKAAPERLARTMSDAEELFTFLEQEPKTKESPEHQDEPRGDNNEPKEAQPELPEPIEETPEPVAADTPSGPDEPADHYDTISPEEFANLNR